MLLREMMRVTGLGPGPAEGAAPGASGGPGIVDLDATIVTAHLDKEQAAPCAVPKLAHGR